MISDLSITGLVCGTIDERDTAQLIAQTMISCSYDVSISGEDVSSANPVEDYVDENMGEEQFSIQGKKSINGEDISLFYSNSIGEIEHAGKLYHSYAVLPSYSVQLKRKNKIFDEISSFSKSLFSNLDPAIGCLHHLQSPVFHPGEQDKEIGILCPVNYFSDKTTLGIQRETLDSIDLYEVTALEKGVFVRPTEQFLPEDQGGVLELESDSAIEYRV